MVDFEKNPHYNPETGAFDMEYYMAKLAKGAGEPDISSETPPEGSRSEQTAQTPREPSRKAKKA